MAQWNHQIFELRSLLMDVDQSQLYASKILKIHLNTWRPKITKLLIQKWYFKANGTARIFIRCVNPKCWPKSTLSTPKHSKLKNSLQIQPTTSRTKPNILADHSNKEQLWGGVNIKIKNLIYGLLLKKLIVLCNYMYVKVILIWKI